MSIPFFTNFQFNSVFIWLTRPSMIVVIVVLISPTFVSGQRKIFSGFGMRAVVIDERLAVLRDEPGLSARLLKRLSRGRGVSILSIKRTPDGLTFFRVAVTRRTRGWIQGEAVVSAHQKGDDIRLLNLIRASKDFDRVARACIFLETFPRSALRPAVLLILGESAEDAARRLSSEAARRLDEAEMRANHASTRSYFLNFNGLDRYRRQGIGFIFDDATTQFHYDGKSWREILRRYPRSVEAAEARKRLEKFQ